MHEQFANWFYGSQAWKNCRSAYIRQKGFMCERCRKRGLIVSDGLEVHHKIKITPQNIHDARITLNFDNLMCVCKSCHEEIHRGGKEHRYVVDETGNVTAR